ncbi:MAG TPA: NUDIX hydrolase [Bacteroidales bacterium]|nr:NUDIX hydrolase [Bacteroidales bacterium]
MKHKWLEWAARLQSIAQAGLTFGENQYDIDRYQDIRNLSIEILQEYTDISHEKLKDLFASETGYQTPKVDIRSAVFKDDKILLVKEKVDGAWSLPGGWADVNTSVSESAVRECLEEAGAHVRPKRIIAVRLANKHNNEMFLFTIYKIFVECELLQNNFMENTETLAAGFFSTDSLPPLSTDRNTRSQIELCFEAKRHKVFETIFD